MTLNNYSIKQLESCNKKSEQRKEKLKSFVPKIEQILRMPNIKESTKHMLSQLIQKNSSLELSNLMIKRLELMVAL